jgi:hypothetical protein
MSKVERPLPCLENFTSILKSIARDQDNEKFGKGQGKKSEVEAVEVKFAPTKVIQQESFFGLRQFLTSDIELRTL